MNGEPGLWFVVPCMGRLNFLDKTAARLLTDPRARYCLVDYSCPHRSGEWFEREFGAAVREGRALVERVVGEARFSKTRAHNLGAARARRRGAVYLCFLDADTLVEPGFIDWVLRELRGDRFVIAGTRDDGSFVKSMTGLLVVSCEQFERVGGFDESFVDWGGEDIEMRLRLYCLGGLDYTEVPCALAHPMTHADELRTQFYDERSMAVSNTRNLQRARRKMSGWPAPKDPARAERLWAGARVPHEVPQREGRRGSAAGDSHDPPSAAGRNTSAIAPSAGHTSGRASQNARLVHARARSGRTSGRGLRRP